ncbi:MAG: hypothetical protein R3D69_10735 [Xanthobacteraceae bacterium]
MLFSNVTTENDARKLIWRLPNSERGDAALALYNRRSIVGPNVVLAGLLNAWDHDHGWVLSAFGSEQAFADAIRLVAPPTKRTTPVRAWRGVSRLEYADGISWTTDRDCACWFALRFPDPDHNPLVFVTDVHPSAILVEHGERNESEILVDPALLAWHRIVLDDGRPDELAFELGDIDADGGGCVLPEGIVDWKEAKQRHILRRIENEKSTLGRAP